MSLEPIGSFLPEGPIVTDLGHRPAQCEKHGPFTSRGTRNNIGRTTGFERWTGCPDCGREITEAEKQAHLRREAQERQDFLAKQLGAAAIPARFIGLTLDSYNVGTGPAQPLRQRALNISRYYAQHFPELKAKGKSMVFMGTKGTGKSHLAAGILQAIMPRYVGVYTTFMGMMNMIRATYEKGAEVTEREVIDKLSSVPLLVIDEIGVQRGTEDEHVQLFGIMDARYANNQPSILITNQSREVFRHYVGDRIDDRLTETAKWVKFEWESYRKPEGGNS